MQVLCIKMDSDGRCETKIKSRIRKAKMAFMNLKELMRGDINKTLKKRLLKCYVWSVLMYGMEAWTLSAETERQIEAFEMWCYRRMMRISYMQRKTNEEVLRLAGEKGEIIKLYKKRKLRYFGHVIRVEGRLSEILMGKIEGKRARGRQRLGWMDEIKRWVSGRKSISGRTG